MREDPRRALRYLALACVQRAKYEGDSDNAPMAEVLWALSVADAEAITARNGPRAWARKHPSGIRADDRDGVDSYPAPRSKADAGRALVRVIERWIAKRPHARDAHARLALTTAHCAELALCLTVAIATRATAVRWGASTSADHEEIDNRIAAELAKVRRRMRYTVDHLAIAALVGWGMSRAKAKDALKNV